MKKFKQFVKTPEEAEKQKRRDETIGYFNALKEVIDEVRDSYYLGDLVAVIEDSTWGQLRQTNENYRKNARSPSPNFTKIYARINGQYMLIIAFTAIQVGLPNISILERLVEEEGMILLPADRGNEDGIVARLKILMKKGRGK